MKKKRRAAARSASVLTPAQQLDQKRKKERNVCITANLIFALVGGLAVLLVTLFGFQDGLPVAERCHCSWSKVIWFTIVGFLTIALQLVGYFIFYNECEKTSSAKNPNVKRNFQKVKLFKNITYTALVACVGISVMTLLLPLLVDQNQNIWWMLQNGLGLFSIILVFLLSATVGLLSKIFFTQRA